MATQAALGLLALVLGLLTVTHVVRLWMVFVQPVETARQPLRIMVHNGCRRAWPASRGA